MRRTVLLVAATVLALIIASGVALAATFTCTTNPCNGTSGPDTITGTVNAETINGQAGNDGISARDGNDQINGGANNDTTNGGNGNDTYKFANSWGADRISADSAGVDTLNYSALTATFTGGNGVTSNLNGHGTTLCPSTANGCLSVAGAFIENVVGTAFADTLSGNPSKNKITGGAGNDSMLGESGNDKMDGNLGDDQYFFTNNWGAETVLDTGGVDRIAWNNPATTGPNLTVNLNSRDTSPEVTDGTNTINWSGNIIEDVQAGPGNDQVTLNSSNNTVVNVSGADAYNGYGPGGPASGVDLIADFGGSPDTLDLSNFNRAKTTFFFGNTGTGTPVIFLGIEFADGSQIWLQDYFDGTSTNGCANGPGIGLMENIVFSDATMNFSAVQAKLGCSSAAGATGNTTADSQTQPLTLKTHRLNTQDSFTGSNSGALSGIQR